MNDRNEMLQTAQDHAWTLASDIDGQVVLIRGKKEVTLSFDTAGRLQGNGELADSRRGVFPSGPRPPRALRTRRAIVQELTS